MSNSYVFDEFLWENIEFICFIVIVFIHIYNNARDNRPRLTRSAILQPRLAPGRDYLMLEMMILFFQWLISVDQHLCFWNLFQANPSSINFPGSWHFVLIKDFRDLVYCKTNLLVLIRKSSWRSWMRLSESFSWYEFTSMYPFSRVGNAGSARHLYAIKE